VDDVDGEDDVDNVDDEDEVDGEDDGDDVDDEGDGEDEGTSDNARGTGTNCTGEEDCVRGEFGERIGSGIAGEGTVVALVLVSFGRFGANNLQSS